MSPFFNQQMPSPPFSKKNPTRNIILKNVTFKLFYILHTVMPNDFIQNYIIAIDIKEAMVIHLLQSVTKFILDITKLHWYVCNANFTFLHSWTRLTTQWPWRCWYAFLVQCLAGKKKVTAILLFLKFGHLCSFAHLLATIGKLKILNNGEVVDKTPTNMNRLFLTCKLIATVL